MVNTGGSGKSSGTTRTGRASETGRPGTSCAAETTVNGMRADLRPGETIAGVVSAWCVSSKGVAVARNGEVVPKSRWGAVQVVDGDSIEILTAAAGG